MYGNQNVRIFLPGKRVQEVICLYIFLILMAFNLCQLIVHFQAVNWVAILLAGGEPTVRVSFPAILLDTLTRLLDASSPQQVPTVDRWTDEDLDEASKSTVGPKSACVRDFERITSDIFLLNERCFRFSCRYYDS